MTDKRIRDKTVARKNQQDFVDRHRAAGRIKRGYYATLEDHKKHKELELKSIEESEQNSIH